MGPAVQGARVASTRSELRRIFAPKPRNYEGFPKDVLRDYYGITRGKTINGAQHNIAARAWLVPQRMYGAVQQTICCRRTPRIQSRVQCSITFYLRERPQLSRECSAA